MGKTTSPGGDRVVWAGTILASAGGLTVGGLGWAGLTFDAVASAAVIGIMIITAAKRNERRGNRNFMAFIFTVQLFQYRSQVRYIFMEFDFGKNIGYIERLPGAVTPDALAPDALASDGKISGTIIFV